MSKISKRDASMEKKLVLEEVLRASSNEDADEIERNAM
ncbi:hypothetical protein L195_g008100 [Trifolium pratense]|uniref:Uncharacterized protein n=1 Tax=Trifolium pratense TaxID=57577 RepID=A0A2K3P866_TRIPR|nr:hypothetical protein L195_g008100 [Trifolium pratense]